MNHGIDESGSRLTRGLQFQQQLAQTEQPPWTEADVAEWHRKNGTVPVINPNAPTYVDARKEPMNLESRSDEHLEKLLAVARADAVLTNPDGILASGIAFENEILAEQKRRRAMEPTCSVADLDVFLEMYQGDQGFFVKALANAALHADPENRAKIKHAFPEYFAEARTQLINRLAPALTRAEALMADVLAGH